MNVLNSAMKPINISQLQFNSNFLINFEPSEDCPEGVYIFNNQDQSIIDPAEDDE